MAYLLLSFVIVFIKEKSVKTSRGDAAIGSAGPTGKVKELMVIDAK